MANKIKPLRIKSSVGGTKFMPIKKTALKARKSYFQVSSIPILGKFYKNGKLPKTKEPSIDDSLSG